MTKSPPGCPACHAVAEATPGATSEEDAALTAALRRLRALNGCDWGDQCIRGRVVTDAAIALSTD